MVISQGEIWWADLPEPFASEPGFRRPVLVVQCDSLNQSRIGTVVCIPLTSNLKWADAPGNLLLKSDQTGLGKDSIALGSQITALDKSFLGDRTGKLTEKQLSLVFSGIDLVLGRN